MEATYINSKESSEFMERNKLKLKDEDEKFTLNGVEFSLAELTNKVVNYKPKSTKNSLFSMINADYIIGIIDNEMLQQLETLLIDATTGQVKEIGILTFIVTMLNVI